MKAKLLILTLALFLLGLPLVFSAPSTGGYIANETFSDGCGNWFLATGNQCTDGKLYISPDANYNNPTRYIHNLTRDGQNQTWCMAWEMSWTAPVAGNYMLFLGNKNFTTYDSTYVSYYSAPQVGLTGIKTNGIEPNFWDSPPHSHFNRIKMCFNSSLGGTMYAWVNNTYLGQWNALAT